MQFVFDRVVKNWKTTASALLTITLVVTGAMASQEITLGHVGTGTVVALITAITKGLLGALQKDS